MWCILNIEFLSQEIVPRCLLLWKTLIQHRIQAALWADIEFLPISFSLCELLTSWNNQHTAKNWHVPPATEMQTRRDSGRPSEPGCCQFVCVCVNLLQAIHFALERSSFRCKVTVTAPLPRTGLMPRSDKVCAEGGQVGGSKLKHSMVRRGCEHGLPSPVPSLLLRREQNKNAEQLLNANQGHSFPACSFLPCYTPLGHADFFFASFL